MIYALYLFGLVLVCFTAIGARSLKSFSRHQLEDRCHRRGAEKRLGQILKEYERVSTTAGMARMLCATILVLGTVFSLLHSQRLAADAPAKDWIILALAVTASLLLAEFWIARPISKLWGTGFAYYTWPLWRSLVLPLYPLVLIDHFFGVLFFRLAGRSEEIDEEEAFEDEIRTMVTEGHREGLLEEDAREMIEGVMELGDFTVSEIMTPRTDMISISSDLSWDEMLAEVISTPHSRIPVYRDNRDDVIGVIHAKDLLRELAQNDGANRKPWLDLMKQPLYVPETKPVDTLLQEFQNTNLYKDCEDDKKQRAKGHLAIVLDEYGGVSGIVTLEDILEEIVGEIIDEHDPMFETEDILEIEPGVFESLGKVHVDDLNETLKLDLPEEEDYDTIAGFIFSTLGHVPEIGETVVYDQDGKKVRFTVLEATRRRIERIRIERNPG